MALFPPWDQLHRFGDVNAVQLHYNVSDDVWTAVIGVMGDPANDLRILAAVPQPALVQSVQHALLPLGESLSAINATQVGLMWRLARRVMAYRGGMAEINFEDTDPWKSASSEGSTTPASSGEKPMGSSASVKEKVLKMSSLIDQMDESELLPPSIKTVNKWHSQYVRMMGSMPDESEEPQLRPVGGTCKTDGWGRPPLRGLCHLLAVREEIREKP